MVEYLKETIKLLLESNKAIAEQLLLLNDKYSSMLEALNGLVDSCEKQSGFAVGDDDEFSDWNEREQNVQSTVHSEENILNEGGNIVTEGDCDTGNSVSESGEDETLCISDEKLNEINAPIKDAIKSLSDNVHDLCNDSEQFFQSVEELVSSYQEFVKSICNKSFDDSEYIQEILVTYLSEYGWANIILRLYAYSKVDSFKYNYLKDSLSSLYELVIELYAKFGIEIELPDLLNDEYDSAKYVYNNESNILIEYFCDLSPSECINKVYDVIQVGYKRTVSSGNDDCHKPVIFYYS